MTWAALGLGACGNGVAPFDGVYDFRLEFPLGDTTRSAVVHVPPTYDGGRAYPLVLAFHGGMMTGATMQSFSRLDGPADRLGFIAAYPDAAPDWDAGRDDLPFVLALVDELSARLRVDGSRVYATGYSRGGSITMRVACEATRRFAAIGVVASALTTSRAAACDPAARIPALLMVGTEDGLVPFEGDPARGILSARETIAVFATHNGCDPTTTSVGYEPDTVADGRRVRRERFLDCGAETLLYVVEGGGHVWFDGDVDAGILIGEFFLRQSR